MKDTAMINKRLNFLLSSSACFALAMLATPSFGDVIVDDSFADGDRSNTGALQADFYGSSTGGAVEDNIDDGIGIGAVGLVSGTSGRQLHAIFPTQTLATAGDNVQATVTFTTPGFIASVATQAEFDAANAAQGGGASVTVPASSDDLKIGLFDHGGNAGLFQDTSYSSGTPNPDFNIAGYHTELDVDPVGTTDTDIDIREAETTNTSGRLLSTNTGTPGLGSGPDLGYSFAPNTQYSLLQGILLNAAGELEITSTFTDITNGILIGTHTETDASPNTFSFGFLGVGASSEAFGLSNDAGIADNGIDINNFLVESTIAPVTVPEPGTMSVLFGGMTLAMLRRRR